MTDVEEKRKEKPKIIIYNIFLYFYSISIKMIGRFPEPGGWDVIML